MIHFAGKEKARLFCWKKNQGLVASVFVFLLLFYNKLKCVLMLIGVLEKGCHDGNDNE
jgi:hypothetical protein